MEKLISIIVPVYQGEKTIERCLSSILNSTHKSLEIIVVDDGSTDNTSKVVNRIAEEDNRVHFIQVSNGGVSRARNIGLQNANGEYIGFVDSDDYILPDMYEKMLAQMTNERDMIICACNHCDEQGNARKNNKGTLSSYEKKCPKQALVSVIYEHVTMAVWSKLFRSKYVISDKGQLRISFQEQLSNYEDFIFICEYIQHCHGNIYFLPERLYNYCYSDGSLSRSVKGFSQIVQSISEITKLKEKYGEELFKVTELFYMDTVWKYWVIQILQNKRYRKISDFSENEDIKKALAEYKATYYSSSYVQKYKKIIVKMILSHEELLFFFVKMGRVFWRK